MRKDDLGAPLAENQFAVGGEITLFDTSRILWQRRSAIVLAGLAGAIAGFGLSVFLAERYVASILVSPIADKSSRGSLTAGGLGELGGLAALAGISLPGGGGSNAEALAMLESETLTHRYIDENNLLPVLFASDWDSDNAVWRSNDSPSLWEGADYFKRRVRSVTEDTRTGLVRLSITWTDPRIAAQWANDLVKLTDDYLRVKAIEESRRNLEYLGSALDETQLIDLRKGIYTMMQAEIEKQMVANGSEYFALKVLDPATVPEKPSSISAAILTAAAGVAALAGAALLVLLLGIRRAVPRLDQRD